MPIYVFRTEDGREVEEVFLSWRDAPQEIEVDGKAARRVPARFAAHFASAELRAAAKQGFVPREPGMEDMAKKARREREKKETRDRHEAIAKTLNQHGVEFSL